MGQEIDKTSFSAADYERFRDRLRRETALLKRMIDNGEFADQPPVGGFELEACLLTAQGEPAPENERFLARSEASRVTPELAKFNIELNGDPQPLAGASLSALAGELARSWRSCEAVAHELGLTLVTIGVLPTLTQAHLNADNMSGMKRYRALNKAMLRSRVEQPIALNIRGSEQLDLRHPNVMLESAATSFQIHLQVPPHRAVRYANASSLVSAPMVAVAANSPFLFGRDLWAESRIALFEQAVDFRPVGEGGDPALSRVTFGSGYLRSSVVECFLENLECYPVILPILFDQPEEALAHLRFHNGTIWRWNRPLIGFDGEGSPHLRIEHRVVAAGPSIPDMIADMALYLGLVRWYAEADRSVPQLADFHIVRENFYRAARFGLEAAVVWPDIGTVAVTELLGERLLPRAREGLRQMAVAESDIDFYLGIIEARLASEQNGANWQRAWVARHGRDMAAMTAAYVEQQRLGRPVHEWPI